MPSDQMRTLRGNHQSPQGYGLLIPHCLAIVAASIPMKYSCVWLWRQGASSFCPWPYSAMSPRVAGDRKTRGKGLRWIQKMGITKNCPFFSSGILALCGPEMLALSQGCNLLKPSCLFLVSLLFCGIFYRDGIELSTKL